MNAPRYDLNKFRRLEMDFEVSLAQVRTLSEQANWAQGEYRRVWRLQCLPGEQARDTWGHLSPQELRALVDAGPQNDWPRMGVRVSSIDRAIELRQHADEIKARLDAMNAELDPLKKLMSRLRDAVNSSNAMEVR